MSRACPACNETEIPERSSFCLACGAPLAPTTESGAAAGHPYTPRHLAREVLTSEFTRAGERKEVTVLFADIAGSLAMAEALDPEQIHAVMDGFFAIAMDAIHAQGGNDQSVPR